MNLEEQYTCRLCLSTTGEMIDINESFIRVLNTCLSLKIFIDSQLPSKICQTCAENLKSISDYRKNIIHNELEQLTAIKNAPIDESEQFHSNLNEHIQLYTVKDECSKSTCKELMYDEVIEIEDSDSNHTTDTVLCKEVNNPIDERNEGKKVQRNSERERNSNDEIEGKQTNKSETNNAEKQRLNNNIDGNSYNMTSFSYTQDVSDFLDGNPDETMESINPDECAVRKKIISSTQTLNKLNKFDFQTSVRVENLNSAENSIDCVIEPNRQQNNLGINDTQNLNESVSDNLDCATQSVQEDNSLGVVPNEYNLELNIDNTPDGATLSSDRTRKGIMAYIPEPDSPEARGDLSCLTCLKVFESQSELSKHYKSVELSQSEKSKEAIDVNAFKAIINEDGKIVYKCKKCGRLIHNKGACKRHLQIHKKNRPLICNLCGRTYKSVADIMRHGAVHRAYYFICTHGCGYRTVRLSEMRDHMKQHREDLKGNHNVETHFLCDECGFVLATSQKLALHKKIHKVSKILSCSEKNTLNKKDHQKVHEKIHTGERLKCINCPKYFTQRCSLRRHIKRYIKAINSHSKEQPNRLQGLLKSGKVENLRYINFCLVTRRKSSKRTPKR